MKIKISFIVAIQLLLVFIAHPQINSTIPSTEELVYKTVGDTDLAITMVSPAMKTSRSSLLMILVDETLPERSDYFGLARILADSGFLVAITEYRMPPDYRFPAGYEDVLDAIDVLKNNKKYPIGSVGLIGQNFGGYLASVTGLKNPSLIQMVTAIHSPLNLETYQPVGGYHYRLHSFIGKSYGEDTLLWQQLSPYHLVKKSSPAFLLMNGTNYRRMPLDQSRGFHSRVGKIMGNSKLIERDFDNGDFITEPNIKTTASDILAFANKNLHDIPEGVEVFKDVVYSQIDNRALRLDIYKPGNNKKKMPAVLFFHGGGWVWGKKEHMTHYAAELSAYGFVTVTVEYRLAREAQYPACIDDAKAAVRWIKSHADEYNIDSERIGVAGESAGGHISALLGVTNERMFLGSLHGPEDQDASVQAVATFSGVVDMESLYLRDDFSPTVLFGVSPIENPEVYRSASPLNLVTKTASPMVFIHGTNDHLGLFSEMEAMTEKLTRAGVTAETYEIVGGDHGYQRFPEMRNSGFQVLLSFMEAHLKK